MCVGPPGTPTEPPGGQTNFDFSAFAVAQSEPGFTRFGCKASIFSYRPQRRGSSCHDSVQVTDVTSDFPDVARRTIGVKKAVASYHRQRTQNLDLIECGEPLVPCPFIAFRKIGVRVVIDRTPEITRPRPPTGFTRCSKRGRVRHGRPSGCAAATRVREFRAACGPT